ncbi:MAG: cadherin domain-containing protein, partial [Lewinella sp.]
MNYRSPATACLSLVTLLLPVLLYSQTPVQPLIEEFNSYGVGNLHEIAPGSWSRERTTDAAIPVVTTGISEVSHSLAFSEGSHAHDYLPLTNTPVDLEANTPFYFGTYFKANSLSGGSGDRLRVAIRIDDDISGDQWVRQQIANGSGGLIARIGLGGGGSDNGNLAIVPGQTLQFVVRGEWDGISTVSYSWTIAPESSETATTWTAAGAHNVSGTPSMGRLFISSVGTGHDAFVGPIRISTNYTEVVGEQVVPEPPQAEFPYQINFQNADIPAPESYLADVGAAYGLKASGLTYGWTKLSDGTPIDMTTPSTGIGRYRGEYSQLDVRQETLAHLQGNDIGGWASAGGNRVNEGSWEIEVPDGWYRVDLSVGDPDQDSDLNETPDHFLQAEGVTVIDVFDVDSQLSNGDPGRFASGSAVVEVTDGKLTINADHPDANNTKINYAIITPTEEPVDVADCSPISLLECNEIPVSLPYVLSFTGTESGLGDKDGELTGFTMVDNHSAARMTVDGPVTYSDVNGYEPARLDVLNGNLSITVGRGIAFATPSTSTNNNNQINTLGVGLTDFTRPFSVETTLLGITTGGGFAQAGLWFGINEDNYVKLNVNGNNVELRSETNGVSGGDVQIQREGVGVAGQNVLLRMEIDPVNGTVQAYYAVNGGAEQLLDGNGSILSLPTSLFGGRTIGDPGVGMSFAGLYSSYRNGSTFDAVYDNFIVDLIPVDEPPVIADQTFSVAEDAGLNASFATVEATDPESASLTFAITGGNDEAAFSLDANSGELVLIKPLDFESTPSYTLSVTVSDGSTTVPATVTVSVTDVDELPTADFTASAPGNTVPVTVSFDASASSDPENSLLTYAWTFGDGTTGTGVDPTHTYTVAGDYTVGLQVTDATANVSEETTEVLSFTAINSPPALGAIGNLTIKATQTENVTLTASDADDLDGLTFEATGLPAFATLTDNGDRTATLSMSPAAAEVGIYPNILVTVSDGSESAQETITIVVEQAPCNPVSLLPCDEIAVSLPYLVTFGGTEGGLVDATGLETGFTMADNHSQPRLEEDGEPTYPEVNGYEPSRLTVGGTNLTVAAAKGINYLARTGDIRTNTHINNLGVGVRDLSSPFSVETQLLNLQTGGSSAQAGLWFGLDEDNFVKLNINADRVELRREINSASGNTAADGIQLAAAGVAGQEVILRLYIDPVNLNVQAYFTVNGGAEQLLEVEGVSSLDLPASFFTGRSLGEQAEAMSFAGIYATYRNGGPFDATFDYFSVTADTPNEAPLFADQTFSVDENSPTEQLIGTLSATDPESEALTFSITSGNESATFVLNESLGELRIAGTLDHEVTASYALSVTASDGVNTTAATVTVTIADVDEVPTASFTTSADGSTVPATVNFDASASSDPEGTSLAYAWDFGDGTLGTGVMPTHEYTIAGDYTVELIVRDAADQSSLPESQLISLVTGNSPPALAAIGDLSATVGQVATYTLTATDPDALDPLTLSVSGDLPAFAGFSDNGDRTATLTISPQAGDAGIYSGITVTVSDGTEADEQTIAIVVEEAPCNPVSLLPCADLAVALPYSLTFDGAEGGLQDATGLFTGFTVVDDHSEARLAEDGDPTYPAVNGYEPSLLNVNGGNLVMTVAKGIAFRVPATSSNNNNQINTLGVGLSDVSQPFSLTTTLNDIVTGPSSAQAGLWYGLDEDNFVKLNVNGDRIELRSELGGVSEDADQIQITVGASGKDVTLRLLIDPLTSTISAFYALDGGAEQPVADASTSHLPLPATYLAGRSLTGPANPLSFAGIYASYRNGTTFDAVFEDFSVEGAATVNTPPTVANQSYSVPEDADVNTTVATVVATDTEQSTLAYSLLSATTPNTFSINASTGDLTLLTALDPSVVDTYELEVEVSDGLAATTATVTITVTPVAPPEVACTPISTLPCDEIAVSLPLSLTFDGASGGIVGTGFTMVDPPSVNQFPAVPSNPEVPGLEEDLLQLSGGKLTITTTKGIAYERPPASSDNNTQVNALGVGIAPQATTFNITTVMDQPDFAASLGNNFQQGGLWYGLDEDNFLKLVVIKRADTQQEIQLSLENVDPAIPGTVLVAEINPGNLPTTAGTIGLRIEVDPASGTATGYYQLDGNAEIQITETGVGSLALPAAFLTGSDHDGSATTPALSYAGVFGTHRRALASEAMTFTFSEFGIETEAPPVALAFAPTEIDIAFAEGSTIPDQEVVLSVSDNSTPAITLSEDPDASGWLILPTTPAAGTLTFGIQPNLTIGTYTTRVIASADGYASAELDITVRITADEPIITLSDSRIVIDEVTGATGKEATVTVTNTGTSPLLNAQMALSGSTTFSLVTNSLPGQIDPGQSAPITVRFVPTAEGVEIASVNVSATDATDATLALRGLGKDGSGGTAEPSLQYIFDAYDLGIAVGDSKPSTNQIDLAGGKTYNDLLGDEVKIERFERAGSGDVTIELLSVYGPESNSPITGFGWYASGEANSLNELFTVNLTGTGSGQTLNPVATGSLTFNPGTDAFGFYNRWPAFANRHLYSEDALNTFSGAIPHHVRVYALPGENNAYVIATEEHTSGFDYQDIVVIARNVKPAAAPPVASTLRVNFSDANTPAPDGYLRDYGLAYANQGAYSYGWVTPGTSTPVSLVGNGRNREPDPDANTLEETLMHMLYGDTGGTNGVTSPGAWEIELPNGSYQVTVTVGDMDTENESNVRHLISSEGVVIVDNTVSTGSNQNVFTGSGSVNLTDGRLTLSATGGFNVKIMAVEIAGVNGEPIAFFSEVSPADGETNVAVTNFQINAVVNAPDGYELDKNSIEGNVKLFEQTANGLEEVEINANDTGGGDAITVTPTSNVKKSTVYVFEITGVEANKVDDLNTRITFQPFVSTFTTTSADDTNLPVDLTGVSFTSVKGGALGEGVADRFTSLVIGPDGKLYGSTTGEIIKRWTIAEDGTLTNLEELMIDLQGSNHPESGVPASDDRLVIGLTFAPEATAENLVAYITHSSLTLTNGPEWDGKLSRISGPNLENVEDVLIHLPRSAKDHLTNSVVVGPENDLFIVQGSNSAGGEPDPAWVNRPERLLAAAVLRVELDKLPAQLPLSLYTTDNISVINAAPGTGITMSDGTYNPYSVDSPVSLFATGIRNAYDMVFHSNGWMYVPTNGTAGNNSNSPNTPASLPYVMADPDRGGVRRPNGTYFTNPTIPGVTGGETQKDWLFKSRGGSYHGHPNPYRGEFILNHGGKAYSDLPGQAESSYTDVSKYPNDLGPDANYMEVAFDFGKNKSPNGAIEYKSNAFDGKMQGMLLVTRFSGQDDIIVLQPGNSSGDVIAQYPDVPGLQGMDDPLEVIEDVRTGNLYAAQYDRAGGTRQQLVLLRADVPALPEAIIAAAPEELLFEVTVNNDGQRTDTKSFDITNEGSAELTIIDVIKEGPFASQYTFTGPTSLTLAPGESTSYQVTFAPSLNSSDLGYQEARMTFTGNGNAGEGFSVGLHGLKKAGFEGGEEPPLQDVVDALGIGINVGWTGLTSNTNPSPMGEEVLAPLFEAAGPGRVGITPVARYSPAERLPFGWYTNLAGDISLNEVGVQLGEGDLPNAQTLYPAVEEGTANSFDPLGAFFGIYVKSNTFNRVNYTEDVLNSGIAHRSRVYPVRDRAGELVANSYLVTFEDATNGDYQDYVYVLTNVKPYAAGAQVLSFSPESLNVPVQTGEESEVRSSTLTTSSALGSNQVTLIASESWIVLPGATDLGTPMDFGVDATNLEEGIYEGTVTASAPGFAPATLRITASVTREAVYSTRINFQDASFSPPSNYLADVGAAYGNRGNGLEYGWIDPETRLPIDNTAQARGSDRGVTETSSDANKLLRSLNMLDRVNNNVPRDWEIALPNGTYQVELAAGDPDYIDSRHTIRAEGVIVIDDFVPTTSEYYRSGVALVEVLDGKLTLDDVGAPADGNTKILYVNIAEIDVTNAPPLIAVNIDGQSDGLGNYRGDVAVALSATDRSGSGIKSLEYSVDGIAPAVYEGPISLTIPSGVSEVTYELQVIATDN